ncbi:hypothetical protein [Capnocytophaga leadbetteri]|jgi:hypothetical protein|uniref:hypothetical protein n=2 Tax=Capnocytophaga leadbetteri TaxID=327575 RepID=UPI0026F09FEE|nr:hypothetical protein [Capnocytophaga leadbetteri]
MSKNILKNRRFYQKNVLKGEEYLQKEKRGIDNVLLLPITVVSSVFYYVAHTTVSIPLFATAVALFCTFYYIIVRLGMNFRMQRYLAKTVEGYHFRWYELWYIRWNDKALVSAWHKKLIEMAKEESLTDTQIVQIIENQRLTNHKWFSYAWFIIVIGFSILLSILFISIRTNYKIAELQQYRRRYNLERTHLVTAKKQIILRSFFIKISKQ